MKPDQEGPVLIVGGGMAGLALAIALGRAGCPAEIVELNPHWNVYGVGIILQSNALRALQTLGLAEQCVDAGYPYAVSRHFEQDGTPRADRMKPTAVDSTVPASCGILRPALHEVLRGEALRLGTRVRLGLSLASLAQDAQGVEVLFTDGTRSRYGAVLGADGIRSVVRRQLWGEHLAPTYTGQGCWRFTLPRPAHVTSACMYHARDGRLAGLVPLSRQEMYLLLLSSEPGRPRQLPDELPGLLRARLQGFGGLIAEACEQIPAGDHIVYRPLETLLVPEPWSHHRVGLMGDAAHATTPHMAQGASMAFEDAVVLAQSLGECDCVPEALARYSSRRFRRCMRVVEASARLGHWQQHPEVAGDAMKLLSEVATELMAPL